MEQKDVYPYLFEYELDERAPAVCEMRLYKHNDKHILVASDVGVGSSVTNNVDRLATALAKRGVIWDIFIDHYPGDSQRGEPEIFEVVTFSWLKQAAIEPRWFETSRTELETIIGQKFL